MSSSPALRAVERMVSSQVQLVGGAGAGELAQPPQGHLDVAGTQLHAVVEVAEFTLVPDLDRLAVAAIGAHADALRMVALLAEGRGAAGTDPLAATLVAFLLLLQAFLELLDQLFQPAQGFNLLPVLVGQLLHEFRPQPVVGNNCFNDVVQRLQILEVQTEGAVKAVEVLLVLHQAGAAEVVEIIDGAESDVLLHARQQVQQLAGGDRNAGVAQAVEKIDQHGASGFPGGA